MNSGELTDKQKLSLEERTAFFINLTGVQAQKSLQAVNRGISTRKLYKILANVVWDWHWLSYKDPKTFNFPGVGELVWVPHKFGALGQVAPSIEYNSIKLYHRHFPNIIELFRSREYAKYNFVDIRKEGDERLIVFAPFIPYNISAKSRLGQQELHFWPILVDIYSKLDDATLNAVASCRSSTATAHSLWIQLVYWKRHMGTALDKLEQKPLRALDPREAEAVIDDFESARICVKQMVTKMQFYANISEHIERVREAAANTELAGHVPCTEDFDDAAPEIKSSCDVFARIFKYLSALHGVCRAYQKQINLDAHGTKVDLTELAKNLKLLTELVPNSKLLDPNLWFTLFLQPGDREIARLCLLLTEEVFAVFEKQLDLRILRPTPHYESFLFKYYPLPDKHFLKGN